MEVLKYPDKSQWKELCKRATMDVTTLFETVRSVLDDVKPTVMQRFAGMKNSLTKQTWMKYALQKQR